MTRVSLENRWTGCVPPAVWARRDRTIRRCPAALPRARAEKAVSWRQEIHQSPQQGNLRGPSGCGQKSLILLVCRHNDQKSDCASHLEIIRPDGHREIAQRSLPTLRL